MFFMLNDIMTVSEACERFGVNPSSFRSKLEYKKEKVQELIDKGYMKYYKPDHKQRGEWLVSVVAMIELFDCEALK
jgi:hypothetical protein